VRRTSIRERRVLQKPSLALAFWLLLWGVGGDATEAANWLTGVGLARQLAQPVDNVVWSGQTLRQALETLSRAQRVAILLDRRVDPGQKLELQLSNVQLLTAMQQLALEKKLGVSVLGSVVYFGPPEVASRLRTVAALRLEEIRVLEPFVARKFLTELDRMKWDDFATPRDLLKRLGHETGIEIVGMERVPHDLWAGADLPPLSLADRLTLLAIQFDLTFEASPVGDSVTLVPVPEDVALVRSYPGGADPQALAEKILQMVPRAQVRVVGNQVFVRGSAEDHSRITSPSTSSGNAGQQPARNIENVRITKLTIQDVPVGQLLGTLAEKLGLDLRIDHEALEAAGVSLEQRVSVSVENATIDQLLFEVIKDCPLRYRRVNNVVEIGPAE